MGRPIKTAKLIDGIISDSGYDNAEGLGVVGGNTGTTGKQIQCDFQLEGSPYTGWIVRQKGARKFLVAESGGVTGICVLVDTIAADGEMTVTITTAGAVTKNLAKFGDTIGTAFDGTTYHLTFGAASTQPPAGSTYEIATVTSI